MPYTHFRFIAWEIPTVVKQFPKPGSHQAFNLSGWNPGAESQAVQRLPVPDSVDIPDARVRLRRLAGVADAAATRLTNNFGADADTLKIFMVPEFYFRPRMVDKTYLANTYPEAGMMQILKALNSMFVHNDFKDWLVVAGTILWNNVQKEGEPLYFNTAVCFRGGQQNALRIIEKRLPAGLDGLPKGMAPGQDEKLKLLFDEWKIRKQRVFVEDGISFGLEVCLDHLNHPQCRVLKKVLNDWSNNSNEAPPGIGFHLLTAGGMSINPESVSTKVGGYILRNDGMSNQGDRSEVNQVESYEWSDQNVLHERRATLTDLEGTATLVGVDKADSYAIPDGALKIPIPQGCQDFKQQIVFYPSLRLPA
jgi:hypothetical protein